MPRHPSKHPSKAVHFHKATPAVDRRGSERSHDKKSSGWFYNSWRPFMGWLYAWICLFDFFLAPVGWPAFLAFCGLPVTPWNPITLMGAGTFHIAMGAIVGVTAYSRGKEKMSPWAVFPQINNSNSGDNPHEVADGRAYIDPDKRFR